MTDHVKYSVIIPVYNSEKTLARCLDSLVCQNRADVQLIVVNDGSRDGSEAIIREYEKKYPGILYISQENAGVSRARNAGLDRVAGEYVTFVDSDDYVTGDYFASLDGAEDCDLLVFANHMVGGADPDERALFQELEQRETAGQRLALLLASRKIMPPWNKRFRRSVMEEMGLRFVEGMQIGEDFNFCFAYALACQSIEILPKPLCCIDISGEDSLSRKYRPHLDDQMCQVFRCAAKADAKGGYLGILDYLFAKNVFTCLAEECKNRNLSFFRDRQDIKAICSKFRQPIGPVSCGIIHKGLRLLLKWKLDFPIFVVAWLAKGRSFRKQAKG